MEDLQKSVLEFLEKVKISIRQKNVLLINREKNRNFLASLGLAPNTLWEIIEHLEIEDFSHISTEHGKPDAMIFGQNVDGIECYVKLNIREMGDLKFCTCISFHPANKRITYPLKGGE